MRTVLSFLLLLLATAGSLPTPGYTEERRFLATAGFGNLGENFRNEEVEICMLEGLTTEDFRELGVNTIGGIEGQGSGQQPEIGFNFKAPRKVRQEKVRIQQMWSKKLVL